MSQRPVIQSVRRHRDKLFFALAYGAVAAVVLFAQPFGTSQMPANVASLESPVR